MFILCFVDVVVVAVVVAVAVVLFLIMPSFHFILFFVDVVVVVDIGPSVDLFEMFPGDFVKEEEPSSAFDRVWWNLKIR